MSATGAKSQTMALHGDHDTEALRDACVSWMLCAVVTTRTGRKPAEQRGGIDRVITHEIYEPRPERKMAPTARIRAAVAVDLRICTAVCAAYARLCKPPGCPCHDT